jgi:hypothetical protein
MSSMNKLLPFSPLLPIDPRESSLDSQSAALIEHIRHSLLIQNEMLRRILDTTPQPSAVLAELLEDTGNRYLDFSERVSAAAKGKRSSDERSCKLKSMPYPSR